jgi:hypothetical protein
VMMLLKYGGMAAACVAIAALSTLMLFLCSTWLSMSTPLAQSIALGALSMCGSGFIALIRTVPREANPPPRCTEIVLNRKCSW